MKIAGRLVSVAGMLLALSGSVAAQNLALDQYTCAQFLSDAKDAANGTKLLRSMMMISWGAGYASGLQNNFTRADAGAFVLIAGVLGDACRKDPAAKAVHVVASLAQTAMSKQYSNVKSTGLTPSGSAEQSLWALNGSILYLIADGTSRHFFYEKPATDLQKVGVTKDSLFFEGKKIGPNYEGTAYVFAGSCDPKAYDVRGEISPDEKEVILHGRPPQVSSACRIVGYRDASLVLQFLPNGQR